MSGTWLDDQHLCEKPLAQKKSFAITIRSDAYACTLTLPMYPVAGKVCVTMLVSPCPHALHGREPSCILRWNVHICSLRKAGHAVTDLFDDPGEPTGDDEHARMR